ncbi:MAG: hypothetical protein DCC72_02060 [Burkholderiales bacterium]|jgi:hypothetical protein|nr:MAG: hypothetical protein DCC72_02060 [Burkholderiales bacterium]
MKRNFLHLLAGIAIAAGSSSLALAAQGGHDQARERAGTHTHDDSHAHASDAHALRLDNGRKWTSDDALRSSMSRIASAVDSKLPAVHAGEMSAAQYDSLGREIDTQVANIVQNCKLEPAADDVLHAILATMMEGNEALQGGKEKAKRSAGVVQVVKALEQYGEYFEHPGFAAPKVGH